VEFIQVIEFTTTKYDEIRAIGEEFAAKRRSEGGPKPVSILFVRDRNQPNSYRTVARFASYEEAMENSGREDTTALAGRIAALCDTQSFHDFDVIGEITP
jgi:hypothetical protein